MGRNSALPMEGSLYMDGVGDVIFVTRGRDIIHPWKVGCVVLKQFDAIYETREKASLSKKFWELIANQSYGFIEERVESLIFNRLKRMDAQTVLPMNLKVPVQEVVYLIDYYTEIKNKQGYVPERLTLELSPTWMSEGHIFHGKYLRT